MQVIAKTMHLAADPEGKVTGLVDPDGTERYLVFSETDPVTGGVIGLTSGGNEVIVISADAPSDADGRPDGTIYIQTA